ncbi:MDR family NADP-dependent oxidoreductase [Clavibacter michiganensis]|uniref:Putative NADP-dependent oxidoreductase YfmJ n=1 Tax=Clavibacter michiganensis TaxID=28447 RepID=A0A251YJP1_9MICO|nr:NADP-dependent oxidoreductase [Clavibacter michiganensis]OUE24258.1 putative NADP-dependent oxidoreductase YfmJ [Clavibacter michiganensis]
MTETTPTRTTAQVVLAHHRDGVRDAPSASLAVRAVAVPPLADGEIRVRNDSMQLTAVMADLMRADPGLPMPPYALEEPLWGGAVGTVVESRAEMPVGTVVTHMSGWREEVVGIASAFRPVDVDRLPSAEHVLNQGVTAYHGMVDVARVGPGDVVFVTGAAGGVGSLAGQIARARGAGAVIGSTGSAEKAAYLVDELGFDAAIVHRDEDVLERLRELAPDGIDVLFDTVAGPQLEAAVQAAAHGARFALCGALAGQVDGGDGGHPRLDVMTAIVKELEIRPFSTMHTPAQVRAWEEHYAAWLWEGRLVFPRTIVEGGLAAAPGALDGLLRGEHRGNVIVRIPGRQP